MREDNSVLNQTILYAYDLGGNILEKRIYIYQPEKTKEALLLCEAQKIVTYGYEDAVWKDKMTSYDGQTITYDAIGNPLSYRGMTFTWKNARELGSVTKDGTTYQYRYNQDGMRNRKYLSDGTVYYQIEGDLIVGEQKIKTGETEPEYEMEFIYDSSGNVIALLYNGTEFYYEKNLQGDIVAIRNVFGELSVTYEYDSWGNVISIGGLPSDRTLGELNPFRYRGYYYDSETGLYYLNSRYYDSETGRFTNSDSLLYLKDRFIGNDLFTYCGNNPVNNIDPLGTCYYNSKGVWCHDNWEYLGGYVRKPDPNAVDITKKLNTEMNDNSKNITEYSKNHNYVQTSLFFAGKVKPGGEWDFKSQQDWNLNPNQLYYYQGNILRFDDIGNIHYGYVGRCLYSEKMLLVAGGVIQIYTKTSSLKYYNSFFDDPRDQEMISYGATLWELNGGDNG